MLHLVGLRVDSALLDQLVLCASENDHILLYPESAPLAAPLRSALGATARIQMLDASAELTALAREVASNCTLTWFDDD